MAWDNTKAADDLIQSSEWNTMVTDQKGRVIGTSISEAIADTAANLPAAGTSGRIFFETDTGRVLYDNGTSWIEVGLSESQISGTNINDNSVSVAGNSVSLGGSTTVDYIDLNDTGASFPIPNSDLSNSSVTVAGNSVSLGGSTAVAAEDLSNFALPNATSAGQLPIYNSTNAQFENSTLTGGTNVTLTNADASITIDATDTTYSAGSYLSLATQTFSVNLGEGVEGDGSDNIRTEEKGSFEPGMTNWADALSNEEIHRIQLQTGETLVVDRIEFRQKGGGTSTSASVRVQDLTAATTIGTTDLGTTTKNPGSSGSGNLIAIQISNSTGAAIDASVIVHYRIQGA